jgi:quinol monooxygenase YgiN
MKQISNFVSVHPYFKIHPGKLEQFRASLPAFVTRTKTERRNLFYDFTINGDEALCREAYLDAEGVLAHLAGIEALLKELMKIADRTRLEVHGPRAELEKLKEPLAAAGATWFVRECGAD